MSKLDECTGVGLKGKTYNFANFLISEMMKATLKKVLNDKKLFFMMKNI